LTIDLGCYPEGQEEGCFRLLLLPWAKFTKAYLSSKKSIKRGRDDENFVYNIKENIEEVGHADLKLIYQLFTNFR